MEETVETGYGGAEEEEADAGGEVLMKLPKLIMGVTLAILFMFLGVIVLVIMVFDKLGGKGDEPYQTRSQSQTPQGSPPHKTKIGGKETAPKGRVLWRRVKTLVIFPNLRSEPRRTVCVSPQTIGERVPSTPQEHLESRVVKSAGSQSPA